MLYSCSDDKRIALSSLGESRTNLLDIKCSNFQPKTMVIHQDLNRLYVAMREPMIFLFDIQEPTPIVKHSIMLPNNSVIRMQLDSTHNRLQCLTRQSQIILF